MRDIGPDRYGRSVYVDDKASPLIRYKVVDGGGNLIMTIERDESVPMWQALEVANNHAPADWTEEGSP